MSRKSDRLVRSHVPIDQETPIRVEFATRHGLHQVALSGPEALERSERAIRDAMGIMRRMAERLRATVASMPVRPSEIEMAFGIKFDAEAGAVIARTGVEASVNVRFRWYEPARSAAVNRAAESDSVPTAVTPGTIA